MNQRLRIGVLGLTHDHVWNTLDDLMQLDEGELVRSPIPIHRCWKRRGLLCQPQTNWIAQQILQAGLEASDTGRTVELESNPCATSNTT